MIRVRSGLVNTPVVPTVQSVPFGVAVIPCRRLLEFWAFGLGTKFHCEPSQFSVKVNWALPWRGTIYWPAVQMLVLDSATMPTRTGLVALGSKIGVGTTLQLAPSNGSPAFSSNTHSRRPTHRWM